MRTCEAIKGPSNDPESCNWREEGSLDTRAMACARLYATAGTAPAAQQGRSATHTRVWWSSSLWMPADEWCSRHVRLDKSEEALLGTLTAALGDAVAQLVKHPS